MSLVVDHGYFVHHGGAILRALLKLQKRLNSLATLFPPIRAKCLPFSLDVTDLCKILQRAVAPRSVVQLNGGKRLKTVRLVN